MPNPQLIVHKKTKSPVAEAFRTLRTSLQFAKVDSGLKTIMITSAGPGEGKSIIAANLAVALAQSGKRVIILDCDLRKPTQHQLFGLRKNRGLTNALVEGIPLSDLIQETVIPNLQVLTSGLIPPNPSELLGSVRMREIIEALKTQADLVVIDSSPVIAVTDACVLASKVDGVVLVLDTRTVRPEMAQRAKELLTKAHGQILGAVLNQVEIDQEHLYYYYYYGQGENSSGRKESNV